MRTFDTSFISVWHRPTRSLWSASGPARARARAPGVRGARVCMDREDRAFEASVLDDRFTSRVSHAAHRSRSETTGSAREAKSEQSGAGQACNTPSRPRTHTTVRPVDSPVYA